MLKLVFLYGPPAAGKFTIAQELSKRTGIPLFHNHDVVDIVAKFFDFGSSEFVHLRESLWLNVFKETAAANKSIIFTFNPEQTVPPSLINKIQAIFSQQNGKTIFVNITCSEETSRQRLQESSRAAFSKLKDPLLFDELVRKNTFQFDYHFEPELILNTDSVKPKEACQLIIRELAQYR